MSLGMLRIDSARESFAFHGPLQEPRRQGCMPWTLRSSLPPKAPPAATWFTFTRTSGRPSNAAICWRSTYGPWPGEKTSIPPRPPRTRDGGLRLQEGVFDALRGEGAGRDVGGGSQSRVDVAAAPDATLLDQVAGRMHVNVARERGLRSVRAGNTSQSISIAAAAARRALRRIGHRDRHDIADVAA